MCVTKGFVLKLNIKIVRVFILDEPTIDEREQCYDSLSETVIWIDSITVNHSFMQSLEKTFPEQIRVKWI